MDDRKLNSLNHSLDLRRCLPVQALKMACYDRNLTVNSSISCPKSLSRFGKGLCMFYVGLASSA